MEEDRIRNEIKFYYWTGVVLYVTSAILGIVHLYQWKGREWVDFAFHLILMSINVTLLSKIRDFRNWARKVYVGKCIILALFLYPMLVLKNDEWIYSRHWPHGILQRVANMSVIVFEVYFVLYLLRRSVRFMFVHHRAGKPSSFTD